ncbi:MAG: hypothetical protein HeimC3_40720 [Candidatus Heimdallarchaeota archaeon LC_3]|nr:MAG: hypothetical protein HeimC3_40720 [Candidatus Heimdallarchaeota archaeon LC_3]
MKDKDELFPITNIEECVKRLRENYSDKKQWIFIPPTFQDELFLKGFMGESLLTSDIKGKLRNNKITIRNDNIREYLEKLVKNGHITIEVKTTKHDRKYQVYNFPEN